MIIPAFNEENVIGSCLAALSPAAEAGLFELLVICNGCNDRTAAVARAFGGVRVVELIQGSKTAAMNLGDALATCWPRLYLDADAVISVDGVLSVLAALRKGDVMAARPHGEMDGRQASGPVRSYYRARERIFGHVPVMWYSGAFGLSRAGHERIGTFPATFADDLYVDSSFDEREKTIVQEATAVRRTPADLGSLLRVLRRHQTGTCDLVGERVGSGRMVEDSGCRTATAALRTVSGPASALDATIFLMLSAIARFTRYKSAHPTWERDDSSRLP